MIQPSVNLTNILQHDSGIDSQYRHAPKQVTPGPSIETKSAVLKWYALYSEGQPVPDKIDRLARSYLLRATYEVKGLGFVILHRCGNDFYFLIVNTWRANNEVWETVFYKDSDAMADFAPWPRDGMHKPTFCVWELVPVWYEKESWERFLKTSRDDEAAQIWLNDLYSGPA